MKNKTIILGLVSAFVAGFIMMFLLGGVGISILSLIKACEKESAALAETQQDSTQKDMIVRALTDKVKDKNMTIQVLTKVIKDKANCEIVNYGF